MPIGRQRHILLRVMFRRHQSLVLFSLSPTVKISYPSSTAIACSLTCLPMVSRRTPAPVSMTSISSDCVWRTARLPSQRGVCHVVCNLMQTKTHLICCYSRANLKKIAGRNLTVTVRLQTIMPAISVRNFGGQRIHHAPAYQYHSSKLFLPHQMVAPNTSLSWTRHCSSNSTCINYISTRLL
jgi:hypothetical protein